MCLTGHNRPVVLKHLQKQQTAKRILQKSQDKNLLCRITNILVSYFSTILLLYCINTDTEADKVSTGRKRSLSSSSSKQPTKHVKRLTPSDEEESQSGLIHLS